MKPLLAVPISEIQADSIWHIVFSPDESAIAIVSNSWLRVYPFGNWKSQSYDLDVFSPEKPYELKSEGALIWDVPDIPAFSPDSRFIALSAGQAERDRSFVLIYDLYKGDLHWFMRIGDESCRAVAFLNDSLVFHDAHRFGLISTDIRSSSLTFLAKDETPIDPVYWESDLDRWDLPRRNLPLDSWIAGGLVIEKSSVRYSWESESGNLLALVSNRQIVVYAPDTFEVRLPPFLSPQQGHGDESLWKATRSSWFSARQKPERNGLYECTITGSFDIWMCEWQDSSWSNVRSIDPLPGKSNQWRWRGLMRPRLVGPTDFED
jgi:hypothetical protein